MLLGKFLPKYIILGLLVLLECVIFCFPTIVNGTINLNTLRKERKKHQAMKPQHRENISKPGNLNMLPTQRAHEKEMKSKALRLENKMALFKKTVLSPYSIKQTMEKIIKLKDDIANVTLEVVRKTAEFNDLILLKMTERQDRDAYLRAVPSSERYATEEPEKKIILIVHGLTSEKFKLVSCLYEEKYFEILLKVYMNHLDKFDIYLMPLANPDGVALERKPSEPFVGFHTWGKNNSPQGSCSGVYLDRNFDIAWNQSRNINSCSQRFPGHAPFSEAESKAIRDVIHQFNHRIVGYINIHASTADFKGSAVLYPKGYTDAPSDDDKYIDLKGEIEEVLKNTSLVELYNMPFEITSLYNWYGKISGSSVDYASQVYGVPFALELVIEPIELPIFHKIYEKYILNDVWKNVIDVIFNYIHKSLNNHEAT